MSIAGLIATLIVSGVVLFAILWPLARPSTAVNALSRQRERALAYYERVLTNVRDLDEDHATGKISDEEYTTERQYWVDRGVRVLALLDDLADEHEFVDRYETDTATIDAAIDEAIAKMRQSKQSLPDAQPAQPAKEASA